MGVGVKMDRMPQVSGKNKKLYQRPDLKVYGDVLKLTGLVNAVGVKTDAMFGSAKSH
jgi:hypothetical protein